MKSRSPTRLTQQIVTTVGNSDTIIAPSRARRIALYIGGSDISSFNISFGTPAVLAGTGVGVGFRVAVAGTGAANPIRLAYDDIGEALYQDVHAIAGTPPANVTVIDVFEADELGPEHYAKQLPQLWDTRKVRAVAL